MPRGRPKTILDNDESLQKQIKNHEYYLKFKSKHPDYYKKIKKVEQVDEVPKEELNNKPEIVQEIDNIIINLNALKNLI